MFDAHGRTTRRPYPAAPEDPRDEPVDGSATHSTLSAHSMDPRLIGCRGTGHVLENKQRRAVRALAALCAALLAAVGRTTAQACTLARLLAIAAVHAKLAPTAYAAPAAHNDGRFPLPPSFRAPRRLRMRHPPSHGLPARAWSWQWIHTYSHRLLRGMCYSMRLPSRADGWRHAYRSQCARLWEMFVVGLWLIPQMLAYIDR